MAEQNINLYPESSALAPLLSAQLVSAFYSALVLKKLSGVEITPEVEKNVWGEIDRHWQTIYPTVIATLKRASVQTSHGQ